MRRFQRATFCGWPAEPLRHSLTSVRPAPSGYYRTSPSDLQWGGAVEPALSGACRGGTSWSHHCAYDTNASYAGLNFVHSYPYDANGNQTSHAAPTVTRGVGAPQAIVEFRTYNAYGQPLTQTDPNGDITTYTYYTGTSTGGNINTPGMYGGYLASVTRGAAGSADPVTSLTTAYKINALGMVTEMADSRGLVTDYEYRQRGRAHAGD